MTTSVKSFKTINWTNTVVQRDKIAFAPSFSQNTYRPRLLPVLGRESAFSLGGHVKIYIKTWKTRRTHLLTASFSDDSSLPSAVPVVNVPTVRLLSTPGEAHTVSLQFSLLRHLVQIRTRHFALSTNTTEQGPVSTIATLHVVQHVPPPQLGAPLDLLSVACRCETRAQINSPPSHHSSNTHSSTNDFYLATVTPIQDAPILTHPDRQRLAQAEWNLWKEIGDVFTLSSRLSPEGKDSFVPWTESDVQRLQVLAPREYDKTMTQLEWDATPHGNRYVWNRRAESFSFAALKSMRPSDDQLSQAYTELSTERRLTIAQQCVHLTKKRVIAALGISDAFRS